MRFSMRKNFILIFLIFIGMFHVRTLFAQDDANKYYLDAYNLYKLGKLDQSLDMLKKVVEVNPDHAEAHFGMGSIYFRQNLFDDAVKAFTKVTRIKPEYVEAYQRLWLAYKKLGMNDKAEQELIKYKKLIEERMQAMGGASPSVAARPVSPPPQKEEPKERSKPEESRPPETRVPETVVSEKKAPESKPLEVERKKPVEVRPKALVQEEVKRSVVEKKAPVVESKPRETSPVELPKSSLEAQPVSKLDTKYKSPYIKVDKNDPKYRHLFKPFRKAGSILFQSPFKKIAEKWEKSALGKLIGGFIYYIMVVQVWLCVVAALCIYFFKPTGNKS